MTRELVATWMGLDTWQPQDEELYRERGKKTARKGYITVSREYLPSR